MHIESNLKIDLIEKDMRMHTHCITDTLLTFKRELYFRGFMALQCNISVQPREPLMILHGVISQIFANV